MKDAATSLEERWSASSKAQEEGGRAAYQVQPLPQAAKTVTSVSSSSSSHTQRESERCAQIQQRQRKSKEEEAKTLEALLAVSDRERAPECYPTD